MLNRFKNILKGPKGFTLIELLAVMAIVATLAGIVSTSVSGTNASSKDAAARQDASTFTSSAGDYFSDQTGAEVVTPSSVTVTGLFNNELAGDVAEVQMSTSNRWPETNITEELASFLISPTTPYTNEFPSEFSDTNGLVVIVDIRAKNEADGTLGAAISRTEFLKGYTAVDFSALVDGGYAESAPDSAIKTSDALGAEFHNYLWLFKKSTTASGGVEDDSRAISLFKLLRIDVSSGNPDDTVDLTYVQIH